MLNNKMVAKDIFARLNKLKNNRFTGSLVVRGGQALRWRFYFRLGRLLWADGGAYPQERWQRNLAVLCPNITQEYLEEIAAARENYENYTTLSLLHKQGSQTEKKQIIKLVINVLSEVYFDIIQYGAIEGNNLAYQAFFDDKLNSLIVLVDADRVYQRAEKIWQQWVEAGLAEYSANLFPIVQQAAVYNQEITGKIHPQLVNLIDGRHSLRALAAISKQDPANLTTVLFDLMLTGNISFSPTPKSKTKINFSFAKFKQELQTFSEFDESIISKSSSENDSDRPLIVCIDDSPIVARALGKFLAKQGYRFLSIKDPMDAITALLKNPPNLIFLDLIMPVINGYELCSQLRRAPNLKDIPIIILTSKDSLIDRVRTKLVGATDFLAKPIAKNEVLTVLQKYLQQPSQKKDSQK